MYHPPFSPFADVEGPVYERVDHGVGHAKEEDPHGGALVDVAGVGEGKHNEDDIVRRPADNEGRHDDGRHL